MGAQSMDCHLINLIVALQNFPYMYNYFSWTWYQIGLNFLYYTHLNLSVLWENENLNGCLDFYKLTLSLRQTKSKVWHSVWVGCNLRF
jgi:hypothetical protein